MSYKGRGQLGACSQEAEAVYPAAGWCEAWLGEDSYPAGRVSPGHWHCQERVCAPSDTRQQHHSGKGNTQRMIVVSFDSHVVEVEPGLANIDPSLHPVNPEVTSASVAPAVGPGSRHTTQVCSNQNIYPAARLSDTHVGCCFCHCPYCARTQACAKHRACSRW